MAGDLVSVKDSFVTRSGRKVDLGIYVRRGDEDRCDHAMRSLKTSMTWDEEVFGLEYDLDVFNIAAVSDFNMGAMENKGLNVFNTKYVLARPETATDGDYQGIETVIAHEYFHNWTGNRVTCRDWFQLSLKEGLTVYRDQEFSADQGSRAVKRIGDVRGLRAAQFREDAGPLAHPVQPASYMAIDNFYTATVYNKGAEVIRMMATIIGRTAFRRGMDLYFERHDNHAVTIDDFVQAMADASGVDLTDFKLWYHQAGTPEVSIEDAYDAATKRYSLTIRQSTKPTPGQPDKYPLVIPVAMGLLDGNGQELATRLEGEPDPVAGTRVLLATQAENRFRIRRCRQSAGAVAAARILGAGETVRAVARPAALPGGARHRSVRALGIRPAIRRLGAAGHGGRHPGWWRTRGRPGADRSRRLGARSGTRVRRRSAGAAGRGDAGRQDGCRRCRCDPYRARQGSGGDRASVGRQAAGDL